MIKLILYIPFWLNYNSLNDIQRSSDISANRHVLIYSIACNKVKPFGSLQEVNAIYFSSEQKRAPANKTTRIDKLVSPKPFSLDSNSEDERYLFIPESVSYDRDTNYGFLLSIGFHFLLIELGFTLRQAYHLIGGGMVHL